MPDNNVGKAFLAGLGLALGLTMAQSILPPRATIEMTRKQVILCLKCGNKNPSENRFCNECGYPLYPQAQMKCQKCGVMTAATSFCGTCGSLLPE